MKFNIFELGIFSFNSYVYYLTRGFIASTRAFNLLTRAFNLPTRAFNLATRAFSFLTSGFELVTRGFELVTCEFELVTRGFELVTREFELVTRGFELVTRNSCFTFPLLNCLQNTLSLNNTMFVSSQNPEESVQNEKKGEELQLPHTDGLRNSMLRETPSASNVGEMTMGLVPSGNCIDVVDKFNLFPADRIVRC